jgi:hypothetical protein
MNFELQAQEEFYETLNASEKKNGMLNLKWKQKITVFSMNGLAMTSKHEMIVDNETTTHIMFKLPRKRKLLQFKKEDAAIVLDGHDLPVRSDMDGNCFSGNACYNLVSEMTNEDLRIYLESHCLNELTNDVKGRIFNLSLEQANQSERDANMSNVLYPEIDVWCAPMDHAKNILGL